MDTNRKLTLSERIARMVHDDEFRRHCARCRNSNPNFEYEMAVAEKIARLNIDQLVIDDNLICIKTPFSEEEIDFQVLEFYKSLDDICPDGIQLKEIAEANMQYLSHDVTKEKNSRSYCCSTKNNGNEFRKIFANIEGRINDISIACHEFCHSMSKSFTKMKPFKDENMREVGPVIVDALSAEFFKEQYPNLEINLLESAIHTQIQNVIKAREVLLDGLVIKLILGETSIDELKKNYGDLYLKNTRILNRCLDNIENKQFTNMFEKKYLLPQAISQIMLEKFKIDPITSVRLLKTIIENDTDWTIYDTVKNIGFTNIENVLDNYVGNFEKRTQNLIYKKQQLQEKSQNCNDVLTCQQ